jgi:teichuronic acid biosynthesis glycosyltransferase TuaG
MRNMPTISVVIPVYTRENVIRRAIDSVLAQTLPPHEIIVVDDGSTDQTADIVAEHYPTVILIRQTNHGLSTARNVGIANASGDLIAFLDSDDCWLPKKLEFQTQVFEEHPELGLVATQKFKNRDEFPAITEQAPTLKKYPFTAFLKRTWFHPSSVIIPRKVLAEVGGFDKSFSAAEDWDMWARVAYHYPVARIEQPLTAVYEMEDSMSRNRPRQYANDIKVIAKWNPEAQDSFDCFHRIHPRQYELFVYNFALLRGLRLYRHNGSQYVLEFLERLDEHITLSIHYRRLLHLIFKALPKKQKNISA